VNLERFRTRVRYLLGLQERRFPGWATKSARAWKFFPNAAFYIGIICIKAVNARAG
jgi:hypothetical protein